MNYLEQMFFDGKAIKEGSIEVGEKEFTYKVSNLTYEQQLEVDQFLSEMPKEASGWTVSHTYIGEVLSRTLVDCNGYTFTSVEECKKYLLARPAIMVETLHKIQTDFEKEIRTLLGGDEVEETFSETPSIDSESKEK